MPTADQLSRRERQVLDVLYAQGASSAVQVLGLLEDPPSNSAIRALLRTMGEKGLVQRRRDGPRFLYEPVVPVEEASTSAMKRLVSSFFGGSPARAAVALLKLDDQLDADERAELRKLIEDSE
ncbi:MAG: BlaI/MecI/CopY family transcriptional regulator [Proteobacteria bacterium]|nr:BlaI/MecI/CopY family transcriptional regulator [Pseudomonadota bacterium]MCP4918121.1 BlaI/MecI/CopY family transcriptional regulator [Pseudomonadota bacterium]